MAASRSKQKTPIAQKREVLSISSICKGHRRYGSKYMRKPVLWVIRLYQRTISRALPEDTCRFYPSCSHYGYEAIEKYGVIKGGGMAIWRIMRCNPWNKGGFDPVK